MVSRFSVLLASLVTDAPDIRVKATFGCADGSPRHRTGFPKRRSPCDRTETRLPMVAGDWRLEGLLGEGALAKVFRAAPAASGPGSGASYALKMLRPQWEDRPEAAALLRREAKVGRGGDSSPRRADSGSSFGSAPYFVVMPRLVGQTLAEELAAGPLPAGIAVWIGRQAAQGARRLHDSGYLHGDVKPANLFIAPHGHVTLIDLGFARRLDESGSAVNRLVLGTINYLAPELLLSAVRAGAQSDIFSLGVVFFEMLTGRVPLGAQTWPICCKCTTNIGRRIFARFAPTCRLRLPPSCVKCCSESLCAGHSR